MQEVTDIGCLVHGFSAHRLIDGLGYSNAGGVAKEIDHVLVGGRWRIIHNCRVYRSAQFLNSDHMLVVATLKLQLKSRRMVPSKPRLYVGKLKDERVAEEFAKRLNGDLGGHWSKLWGILKSCGVPSRPPSSCWWWMSWNSL